MSKKSHKLTPKNPPIDTPLQTGSNCKDELRNARPSIRQTGSQRLLIPKNTLKKAWMENFHPCFFLLILLLSLRLAPAEIQSLQTAG